MTADEIRGWELICHGEVDGAYECARFLREIAAQLAELNATLKSGSYDSLKVDLVSGGPGSVG